MKNKIRFYTVPINSEFEWLNRKLTKISDRRGIDHLTRAEFIFDSGDLVVIEQDDEEDEQDEFSFYLYNAKKSEDLEDMFPMYQEEYD
jgi:hypothetical protein